MNEPICGNKKDHDSWIEQRMPCPTCAAKRSIARALSEENVRLRDQFAMAAMTGLLAKKDTTEDWSMIVEWAYDIADIALKVRKERT